MPIIVPCPQCHGQLRVADDLIGRKVRCPACAATFDAAESMAPPPPPEPPPSPRDLDVSAPTESLDPWKHLNLELTPERPEAEERPPVAPRGAVEIDATGPRPQAPAGPPRRARLRDDHDDLRPCPSCGRMAHRDARRCLGCGARLRLDPDDEEGAAYRTPRLDREPHRGGLILTLGIVGLVSGLVCWPISFLAIVPSVLAWALGTGDLRKIRQGAMDPDGESSTQAGWICGIIGTATNALLILGCSTVVGLWSYGLAHHGKDADHAPFAAPAGKRAPWQRPR